MNDENRETRELDMTESVGSPKQECVTMRAYVVNLEEFAIVVRARERSCIKRQRRSRRRDEVAGALRENLTGSPKPMWLEYASLYGALRVTEFIRLEADLRRAPGLRKAGQL